ncbi:MAG: NUDIX domain-containing protein [Actinocatenispora sp.]
MADLPRHPVAVAAAVVDDDGLVLALRRPEDGRWEPPGGMLEVGESIVDGLRREVREETGLDVEPGRLGAVYQNTTTGTIAMTFRCRPTGGTLTVNDEASDFRWLHPDELSTHMPEIFAGRVLDALSAEEPVVRLHDGRRLL